MLVWLDRGRILGFFPALSALGEGAGNMERAGNLRVDWCPKQVHPSPHRHPLSPPLRHYLAYVIVWFYIGFETQFRCHFLHAGFPALKWSFSAQSRPSVSWCAFLCLFPVILSTPWGHPVSDSIFAASCPLRAPSAPPGSSRASHSARSVHMGWNETQPSVPLTEYRFLLSIIVICAQVLFSC